MLIQDRRPEQVLAHGYDGSGVKVSGRSFKLEMDRVVEEDTLDLSKTMTMNENGVSGLQADACILYSETEPVKTSVEAYGGGQKDSRKVRPPPPQNKTIQALPSTS